MFVFVQGKFVPEEQATVSVFDRGFRYGDALFETLLLRNGKTFRWADHWRRFERSANFLKIPLSYTSEGLFAVAQALVERNVFADGMLRIHLTRGVGPRGYAPGGDETPFLIMSLHQAPGSPPRIAWNLCTSRFRITAGDPLANHKTGNRLLNVCAAMEAQEQGVEEAILLNTNNDVAEASSSNVFWISNGTVGTPPLSAGSLPGVTRKIVLELCETLAIPHVEQNLHAAALSQMDGVFLTLSSRGIVEAGTLDGNPLPRSDITARLQEAFEALLTRECPPM